MTDIERMLTVGEASAVVGDDIAYWFDNPYVTRDMLAEKVAWWITVARRG